MTPACGHPLTNVRLQIIVTFIWLHYRWRQALRGSRYRNRLGWSFLDIGGTLSHHAFLRYRMVPIFCADLSLATGVQLSDSRIGTLLATPTSTLAAFFCLEGHRLFYAKSSGVVQRLTGRDNGSAPTP